MLYADLCAGGPTVVAKWQGTVREAGSGGAMLARGEGAAVVAVCRTHGVCVCVPRTSCHAAGRVHMQPPEPTVVGQRTHA